MLTRKNRLTASSSIEQVVLRGARVQGKYVGMYYSPSHGGDLRFACVAGKKVHASAVIRHGVQRKLRAACREIVATYKGSYDIVVVARTPEVASVRVQEIISEITKGLPQK